MDAPRSPGFRRKLLTAVGGLIAALIAFAVYYIQTDYGVVRIEVADDSLEVQLAGETITAKDGEKEISIRTGEQKLIVKLGDDSFETEGFQLRRGDKIALKAELVEGQILVRKDGAEFDSRGLRNVELAGSSGKLQPSRSAFQKHLDALATAVQSDSSNEKLQAWMAENDSLLLSPNDPATRAVMKTLGALSKEDRERLLEDGYLKWPYSQLDPQRQAEFKEAVRLRMFSQPAAKVMNAETMDSIVNNILKNDVGFYVTGIPDSEEAMLSWFPTQTPIPLFGSASGLDDKYGAKLLHFQRDRVQEVLKLPNSPLPKSVEASAEIHSQGAAAKTDSEQIGSDSHIRLYTVSDKGDLMLIELSGGSLTTTLLKRLGSDLLTVEGLTSAGDTLYAAVNRSDGESRLFSIDMDALKLSLRGTLGIPEVDGLAWVEGELLGVTSRLSGNALRKADAGRLLKINPATARTHPVGNDLGLNDLDSLVYDDRGRLTTTDGVGLSDHFYELDRRGITRPKSLAPTPRITASRDVEGLAQGSDGMYYAVTNPGATAEKTSYLLRIDPETFRHENLGKLPFGTYCIAADRRELPKNDFDENAKRETPLPESGPDKISLLHELPSYGEAHGRWVDAVAFPTNDEAISISGDGEVRVWNPESGEQVGNAFTLPGAKFAISADGRYLASATSPNRLDQQGRSTIEYWDRSKRKAVWQQKVEGGVHQVEATPHGVLVTTTAESGHVWLLDLETGEVRHRLAEGGRLLGKSALSPEGERLFVRTPEGRETAARILRIEDGATLAKLDCPDRYVESAVWSRDGRYVLGGTADGRIRIWNAETGELVQFWPADPLRVQSLVLGPGQLLFAGGARRITIWDWSRPVRLVATVDARQLEGLQIAIASDGRRMISGGGKYVDFDRDRRSNDHAPRIWKLPESVWPTAATQPRAKSKQSIKKGLDYLAKTQREDGHWEAENPKESAAAYPVAMTALAGMTMLMEGSTLEYGLYSNNLQRAVNWLMAQSQEDGRIAFPLENNYRYMFGHGYAMLFLSSVYHQEPDGPRKRKLDEILTKAVLFTEIARTPRGGWGYVTAAEGNNFDEAATSITQLQALRAARNAGIHIPRGLIDAEYLRKFTGPTGGVVYTLGSKQLTERPALTAAALAGCEYDAELFKKWLQFAQKNLQLDGKSWLGHRDYAHYYYAQAMYILADDGYGKLFPDSKPADRLTWSKYRESVFDEIIDRQEADGSWSDNQVGPVYGTACSLTVLLLDNDAVPIYRRASAKK